MSKKGKLKHLKQKCKDFKDDILYSIEDTYYKIGNKYFVKYNVIKIRSVSDTQYLDYDAKLMHGMFQVLVDFVECGLGPKHLNFNGTYKSKTWSEYLYNILPYPFYHLVGFRSAKNGIAYLEKSIKNKSKGKMYVPEAIFSEEVLKLYEWWKITRPNRIDPDTVSGFDDYDDYLCKKYGPMYMFDLMGLSPGLNNTHSSKMSPDEIIKHEELLQKSRDIEEEYRQEDLEMMRRLVNVHEGMWC